MSIGLWNMDSCLRGDDSANRRIPRHTTTVSRFAARVTPV
jgi:hypothetical protein